MPRSHITKAEAQAVADYAATLCRTMRMPGWQILVMEEPADDDANAMINWIDQRYVARLWLGAGWMKLTSDERRMSITHEVMHLWHSRASIAAIDDSQHLMHEHEHDDWTRRLRREFELMVDQLATFMADTHHLKEAWDEAHGKATT